MLLTFSIENFGPYRDKQIFDMRAVPSYKEHPNHVEPMESGEEVLKLASIYGANASGKSQLLDAYYAFQYLVVSSFLVSRGNSNVKISSNPLQQEVADHLGLQDLYRPYGNAQGSGDIEFEAFFELPGIGQYRYGFSYNAFEITNEWLYYYKTDGRRRRQTIIFERSNSFDEKIALGSSIRNECEKYASDLPDDALALSFFAQLRLKTEHFVSVRNVIRGTVVFLRALGQRDTISYLISYFYSTYQDSDKEALLSYLQEFDISIRDIRVERQKDYVSVTTVHKGADGMEFELPIGSESDGTQKMIALYSYLSTALRDDLTVFVDGLDDELHPLILRRIAQWFNKPGRMAQLIFTCHDVTLLDKRYMRRDQVWFVSKDEEGCSSLHSLAEYRLRNDASFSSAYLGGVFGAIPNLVRDVTSANGEL